MKHGKVGEGDRKEERWKGLVGRWGLNAISAVSSRGKITECPREFILGSRSPVRQTAAFCRHLVTT